MQKLIIQDIEQLNAHWYVIRYSGDDQAFRLMTELLARQKRYNAYYEDGRWIVRAAWLEKYRSRFHNLDRALTLAQTRVAQKKVVRRG